MPTGLRSQMLSSSDALPGPARAVPVLFLLGWVLLVTGDVFGPGGAPNIPFCLAVVAGIRLGSETGFWTGLTLGLAADLASDLAIGVQAIPAACLGAVVGWGSLAISPDSLLAPLVMQGLGFLPYRLAVRLLAGLGGLTLGETLVPGGVLPALVWDVATGLVAFVLVSRLLAVRSRP